MVPEKQWQIPIAHCVGGTYYGLLCQDDVLMMYDDVLRALLTTLGASVGSHGVEAVPSQL